MIHNFQLVKAKTYETIEIKRPPKNIQAFKKLNLIFYHFTRQN